MPDVRVSQFMTSDVSTVPRSAPLSEVAERMRTARLSCLVVVDGRRPVGVITERDLTGLCARLLAGEEAGDTSSVMSDAVVTLPASAGCVDAVELARRRQIRRLVVVDDDGELSGIITQTDLLRAHTHEIETRKALLEQRVAERTRELEALNERLEGLSRIDPLLGIGNRRAMDEELDKMSERARRYDRAHSLALVDVDHFKLFNDRYGHQDGDAILSALAQTMQQAIRAADSIYRYGGEEFLVLFPEVNADGAAVACEHIRKAVEDMAWPHEGSPLGRLTVSIGVAGEDRRDPNPTRTISLADQAVYRAKRRGRNRVELGQSPEEDRDRRAPRVA